RCQRIVRRADHELTDRRLRIGELLRVASVRWRRAEGRSGGGCASTAARRRPPRLTALLCPGSLRCERQRNGREREERRGRLQESARTVRHENSGVYKAGQETWSRLGGGSSLRTRIGLRINAVNRDPPEARGGLLHGGWQ